MVFSHLQVKCWSFSSWFASKPVLQLGAVEPCVCIYIYSYICCTTAAAVPPAAEESVLSQPNPGSAIQNEAKTGSLEPNEEKQTAPSTSQESGECPPLAKQERTGTGRTGLDRVYGDAHVSAASLTCLTHRFIWRQGLHLHPHLSAYRCWLLLTILCPLFALPIFLVAHIGSYTQLFLVFLSTISPPGLHLSEALHTKSVELIHIHNSSIWTWWRQSVFRKRHKHCMQPFFASLKW